MAGVLSELTYSVFKAVLVILDTDMIRFKAVLFLLLLISVKVNGQNSEVKEAMSKVSFFIGTWKLESSYLGGDSEWVDNPDGAAEIQETLKGLALIDRSSFYFHGVLYNTESLIGYDRLRYSYRQLILDDLQGYPDVHEGNFEGDAFIVSNLNIGTPFIREGKEFYYRTIYNDIQKDSFTMTIFASTDKENWNKIQVIKYIRK